MCLCYVPRSSSGAASFCICIATQERIIFYNRTQMNADNQDFKYKVYENAMMIELNFGTKPEVKRKAFDNLRK